MKWASVSYVVKGDLWGWNVPGVARIAEVVTSDLIDCLINVCLNLALLVAPAFFFPDNLQLYCNLLTRRTAPKGRFKSLFILKDILVQTVRNYSTRAKIPMQL